MYCSPSSRYEPCPLPRSVLDTASNTLLEKTDFPFASRYQVQTAFSLRWDSMSISPTQCWNSPLIPQPQCGNPTLTPSTVWGSHTHPLNSAVTPPSPPNLSAGTPHSTHQPQCGDPSCLSLCSSYSCWQGLCGFESSVVSVSHCFLIHYPVLALLPQNFQDLEVGGLIKIALLL